MTTPKASAKKKTTARRQGPRERAVRRELRAAGWTATLASPIGTLGEQAIYLAQLVDATTSARDGATVNRELRMTMADFRAAKEPAKGDAVDDAADEFPGGNAGSADPGSAAGGVVLPFGAGRPSSG